MKLRTAVQTDIGVVREHNEDSAVVDNEADFFVVADGMGGHAAGEVASEMAVETVREELSGIRNRIRAFESDPTDAGRKELVALLEAAVRKAHSSVYERGIRERDKQGMGTTLDVVLLAGPEAFVAHVGDSRTYLIRDGKAVQITTDHTVAEVLVIEGKLSVEEAQHSPLRTILVNAIGVAPEVGVEMAHLHLRTDDQILLCSDGLHDYFPAESELADHISGTEPKDALNAMVELAKTRGGHDNITGIVVEVLKAPPGTGASPFEVELTAAPAPDRTSTGDTIPHVLVEESDLDDSDLDDSDRDDEGSGPNVKETIPMRPADVAEAVEREKLARASTIPPEHDGGEETDPDDSEATEDGKSKKDDDDASDKADDKTDKKDDGDASNKADGKTDKKADGDASNKADGKTDKKADGNKADGNASNKADGKTDKKADGNKSKKKSKKRKKKSSAPSKG